MQQLNSCTWSRLTELEQFTPVVEMKGSVRDSVWRETPEEGRRIYRPKRCDYNNKDEVDNSNILSNNNYQASSQKFKQYELSVSPLDRLPYHG